MYTAVTLAKFNVFRRSDCRVLEKYMYNAFASNHNTFVSINDHPIVLCSFSLSTLFTLAKWTSFSSKQICLASP